MLDLNYNYVRISSVSKPPDFSTFPLVPNLFANASINDYGYVDYEALVGSPTNYLPPSAILSGNGSSTPTTLIDTTKYQFTDNTGKTYDSAIFYSPSINSSGTTVLAGAGYDLGTAQVNGSGPTAVQSVTNGSINNVANSSTPFVTVALNPNQSINDLSNQLGIGSFVSAPGINNQGTIAYVAGNSDGISNIYTKSSSGVKTSIADTSSNSSFSNFYFGGLDVGRGEGPFAKYTLPAINDKGAVAFNADLKGGGKGIFVNDGTNLKTIVAETTNGPYSYFSVPTLNDLGTVAFNAGFTTGGAAIFESINGKLSTIADTSSGSVFKDFKSDVALNQEGDVTFLADLNDGGSAIYTSSASGLHKVIGVGDALDGSTVTSLFISHEGLNNNGQIAFDAVLANGGQEVFRADPVAVPEQSSVSSFSSLVLATFCIVSYYWRHTRGQDDKKNG
jgi:hypothetical protein